MAWLENNTTNAAPASQPTQQSAPAQPTASPSTPMIATDGSARMIPNDAVNDATNAGYKPATKMVDPQGTKRYVPTDMVADARQHTWAVTPDNPGVVKAVDYNSGQVNYILPHEVENFHSAGQAIVQPDGSIRYPIIRDKNGVIGQDPLAEQQAHQKVYAALNADEAGKNRSFELKEAGKSGAKATLATAAGVTGSSGLAALLEPTTAAVTTAGGVGFGGAAPTTAEVAGPSLASQGAQWLSNLPTWLKVGAAATAGGSAVPAVKKWLLGGGH